MNLNETWFRQLLWNAGCYIASKTLAMSNAKSLHRGEAVLRKHLRTFEENQISNIIRKTKGKRRLKFHQFYSAKKYPKLYA